MTQNVRLTGPEITASWGQYMNQQQWFEQPPTVDDRGALARKK